MKESKNDWLKKFNMTIGKIFVEKDMKIMEVLEREISAFGTGAHIIVPQKYLNQKIKAKILILKEEESKS